MCRAILQGNKLAKVRLVKVRKKKQLLQVSLFENLESMNHFIATSDALPCLAYLSFIHEKAMYRYVLDGKSALA